jgi:hypothetical protein
MHARTLVILPSRLLALLVAVYQSVMSINRVPLWSGEYVHVYADAAWPALSLHPPQTCINPLSVPPASPAAVHQLLISS